MTIVMATACTALLVGSASAECVQGSVSAELQLGGPFVGLWKYTVEITWDTPQGLSNVTVDCGFEDCPEIACAQTWLFDDPAGHGTGGEPGDCEFDLVGEFNCEGNPSIGVDHPIIKWDAVDTEGCQASTTGSATLCFYTNVAPGPGEMPVSLIKNGLNVCDGMLSGVCPLVCPLATEDSNWGKIKFLFEGE